MKSRSEVTQTVLDFYKRLPFNYPSSPQVAAKEISSCNTLSNYFKKMEKLFTPDKSVLELGCGTGWMSNMINYYHNCNVLGVDINPIAIEYAQKIASELKTEVKFLVSDIFDFNAGLYDIVLSIGVLHHTFNCNLGIKRACELTKKNGQVIIGLYNSYGRRPFLDYFKKLKLKNYNVDELFEAYKKLDSRHKDETFSRSWFNDQVLHPHETLHTLSEVNSELEKNGVKLIGVSFNDYESFSNINDLYKLEMQQYDKAMTYIEEGKFYSGLFIVIGEKL